MVLSISILLLRAKLNADKFFFHFGRIFEHTNLNVKKKKNHYFEVETLVPANHYYAFFPVQCIYNYVRVVDTKHLASTLLLVKLELRADH